MPVIEFLVIKGLAVAFKAIASKGLTAKVGTLLLKSVIANGLGSTITTVVIAGAVIGGVVWTHDRIQLVGKAITALENRDIGSAAMSLGKLVITTPGLSVHSLPDTITAVALKAGLHGGKVVELADFIRSMEGEIGSAIRRLR
jgi:hypothetical protein